MGLKDTQKTINTRPSDRRYGRYRVRRELGVGGMGAVYVAHDAMLQRDVAVKTIACIPGVPVDEFRARFLNEARCVAALKHPNIVPVHDMGIEGDVPFLVMELLPGPSLKDLVESQTRLAPATVRALGIQIANALAAAHGAGILHRDVKPANLLDAGDGSWKLVDFGVARAPDSSLTVEGQFLGTPSYASPETLESYQFSPAADVWALGATLYEALAGQPPYGRGTAVKIALEAAKRDPLPLAASLPDVPEDLAAAIAWALQRDPTKRPSASQLAHALAVAGQSGVRASIPPSGRRWRRIAVGTAILATVGLAIGLARMNGDEGAGTGGAGATGTHASLPDSPRASAVPEPARHGNPSSAAKTATIDAGVERESSSTLTAESPSRDRPAVGEPEPELGNTDHLEALMQRRDKSLALSELGKLRKQHPTSAYVPYLQGKLYFERLWWKDGFEAYGAAVRNDPRYREYSPVIRDAIRALSSRSQPWRATRFIRNVIGAPAVPFLKEAATHSRSKSVRQRARRLLGQLS